MSTPEELGVQLVCPACRSDLNRQADRYVCANAECRRAYAILDGIPKMLIDDAEVLPEDGWRRVIGAASNVASEE